ncbi:MAG TPA: GNAT family N-acetyltransferase [Saprospiraceae bacterium]|nr:GNAT family N-acetyltransferase [Saprospiraceae bacterium]
MRYREDIVDESVMMQPMHPSLFDDYLAEGWRLLGYTIIRHSVSMHRGLMCGTVPLRIRLQDFSFTKSQRVLLRRNAQLCTQIAPIRLTEEKHALFLRHAERFQERRPSTLSTFLTDRSAREPVPGFEMDLRLAGRSEPIGHSFFHLGWHSMCGTYCFFDPDYGRLSPGLYLMLREIEHALSLGLEYYYPGYCYDVPSYFDYKLNFNNLEIMDWRTSQWAAWPRGKVCSPDVVYTSGLQ